MGSNGGHVNVNYFVPPVLGAFSSFEDIMTSSLDPVRGVGHSAA